MVKNWTARHYEIAMKFWKVVKLYESSPMGLINLIYVVPRLAEV